MRNFIGDHQQLRPPVTVYKLAKDFALDVSLFERLIKNGMEPCVLGVQHRMRPEIARLIVPAIYPSLENHPSVLEYPVVRGISSNVFFLSHTEQEEADHEEKSHLNPYEAKLSLALARHFIMQGYDPDRITILTTYSGQLLYFFKLRKSQSAVQSVRISVVDNFQGEENDIIILSLVRSNDDENIGFLRIENRICVALSRAKHGFFMIGNMQNLQGRSQLWNSINQLLSSNGQLGPDFNLKCGAHNTLMKVKLSKFLYLLHLLSNIMNIIIRFVKRPIFRQKADAWRSAQQRSTVGIFVLNYATPTIEITSIFSAKKSALAFVLLATRVRQDVPWTALLVWCW